MQAEGEEDAQRNDEQKNPIENWTKLLADGFDLIESNESYHIASHHIHWWPYTLLIHMSIEHLLIQNHIHNAMLLILEDLFHLQDIPN